MMCPLNYSWMVSALIEAFNLIMFIEWQRGAWQKYSQKSHEVNDVKKSC